MTSRERHVLHSTCGAVNTKRDAPITGLCQRDIVDDPHDPTMSPPSGNIKLKLKTQSPPLSAFGKVTTSKLETYELLDQDQSHNSPDGGDRFLGGRFPNRTLRRDTRANPKPLALAP